MRIGKTINGFLNIFNLKLIRNTKHKNFRKLFDNQDNHIYSKNLAKIKELLPSYFRSIVAETLLKRNSYVYSNSDIKNFILNQSELNDIKLEIFNCLNEIRSHSPSLRDFCDDLTKKMENFHHVMEFWYQREIKYAEQLNLSRSEKLTIWEIASGSGMLSLIAEMLGHNVICTDIGCDKGSYYPDGAIDEWIRNYGFGLKNPLWFEYNPMIIKTLTSFSGTKFDIITMNGVHVLYYYAYQFSQENNLPVDDVLCNHIIMLLELITSNGILQMCNQNLFADLKNDDKRSLRVIDISKKINSITSYDIIQAGIDDIVVDEWQGSNMSLVIQKRTVPCPD